MNNTRIIQNWIGGPGCIANFGAKIKCPSLKEALAHAQAKYPEREYVLTRHNGLWYITQTWDA